MADSVVIVGPTASGKTAVAVGVAQRLGGEVISFDSRQVYRGMDIGTAKPTMEERGGVPHHGFDLVAPDARYNAGRFACDARTWLEDIRGRGRVPVLAGGTGFFLRALLQPMFDEPPMDEASKERWKHYLAGLPAGRLAEWARTLDPDGSAAVTDRQRLARLVEIAVLTGRPLGWWHAQAPAPPPAIDPHVFVLDLPREALNRRIEQRVDAMLRAGLVEEVRRLVDAGFDERAPGMNATGYIELIPHVRGERPLEEAAAMIVTATRQYARRQRTWLRHQLPPGARWVDAGRPADAIVEDIVQSVGREGN